MRAIEILKLLSEAEWDQVIEASSELTLQPETRPAFKEALKALNFKQLQALFMAGVLGEEFDDNPGTEANLLGHWAQCSIEPAHQLILYIAGSDRDEDMRKGLEVLKRMANF